MKKILKKITILTVVCVTLFCFFGFSKADETVYLCGFAAGFEVNSKGVSVVRTTDVVTLDGVVAPSKGIIDAGDRIMKINDKDVSSAKDVETALGETEGEVVLTISRDGETLLRNVTPAKDVNGLKRLGLLLKDGTSGIGTMTFIKKDGTFMALGHPICSDKGDVMEITEGKIFRCSLFGVNKGDYGRAGELKGMIIGDMPIGTISANVEQGIIGKMDSSYSFGDLPLIEVGQARMGKATVVTCVDGVIPKEYEISLVKVDTAKESKNFVVKVTDKELIKVAGGIVQGMSGSPIIQDGKIVGALTHVFIGDSTRGYGISIDNMLGAIDAR